MSKLKLSQVEAVLEGDDSYATIVDYLRLVQKYGTKIKFSAIDPQLFDILRCNSYAAVSGKLIKLYNVGLADRERSIKKGDGRTAFIYTMK
jgi:hypothetical protein